MLGWIQAVMQQNTIVVLIRFDRMDPNLHLHSCYRKCIMDYRHLWFSNNPCNISFSFWPSNPHCLPRIWTFGFDIFWPFYLWSIWWWLPIRPELHELQPRINNQNIKITNLKNNISYQHYQLSRLKLGTFLENKVL